MVCIALLFVMAMMTGFTTSRHVTIAVDGRTIDMNTTYRTPTTILRQAGVNMNVQDEYHMTEDRDRTYIAIYRAVPVTVEYQGKKQTIRTSKPTVENCSVIWAMMGQSTKLLQGQIRKYRKTSI